MAKRKKKKTKKNSSGIKNIFVLILSSPIGKLAVFLVAVTGILSFNILLTKNVMEQFLFLTGIQIIIAILIFWTLFIFRYRK